MSCSPSSSSSSSFSFSLSSSPYRVRSGSGSACWRGGSSTKLQVGGAPGLIGQASTSSGFVSFRCCLDLMLLFFLFVVVVILITVVVVGLSIGPSHRHIGQFSQCAKQIGVISRKSSVSQSPCLASLVSLSLFLPLSLCLFLSLSEQTLNKFPHN